MKGLFLAQDYFPPSVGGATLYVCELTRGHSPDELVTMTARTPGCEEIDARLAHTVLRRSYIRPTGPAVPSHFQKAWMLLRWCLEAPAVARRHQCDFVLVGHVYFPGIVARRVRRALGLPYVVFAYGEELSMAAAHRKSYGDHVRRMLTEASGVVTISEFTRQLCIDLGADPEKIEIITPGVDTTVFTPGPDEGLRERLHLTDAPVLLTVGRMIKRKGGLELIQALPEIRKHVPGSQCVIVGSGPMEPRIRAEIQRLHLEDCVRLAGEVPSTVPYYRMADLFVMPNRTLDEDRDTEGFGIVFLEAGACRLPVIGGRAGGTVDAVEEGRTGFLVDNSDPQQIADLAVRILSDQALHARLAESGYRRATEAFSWDRRRVDFREALRAFRLE